MGCKIEQELPEVTVVPAGIIHAYLHIYRTIEKGAGNTLKNYIPMKLPSIYFCFPVVFFLIIFHQMLQSYKMACVCYLCSFHPFSSPAPFWMQKHLPKAMPCLSLVNKVKSNL